MSQMLCITNCVKSLKQSVWTEWQYKGGKIMFQRTMKLNFLSQ
jgi:hypothetical protein